MSNPRTSVAWYLYALGFGCFAAVARMVSGGNDAATLSVIGFGCLLAALILAAWKVSA